jgi:hypothetical protein
VLRLSVLMAPIVIGIVTADREAAPTPVPANATSLCLPPDTVSVALVAFVQNFMNSTSPTRIAVRDSLGLSKLTAANVAYSTKSTTCQTVSRTLDAAAHMSPTGRLVYVISVGTKTVFGADQTGMTGSGRPIYVFNSTFSIERVMLGP